MAAINPYLIFNGNCEEAFLFYKSVFGGEFLGDIMRLGDAPVQEGMPPLAKEDKNFKPTNSIFPEIKVIP